MPRPTSRMPLAPGFPGGYARAVLWNRSNTAALFAGEGRRMLDVGFGKGSFLELVRGRFVEQHGVDLDPEGFTHCAGRGFRLVLADLDRAGLPYREACFDLVSCLDVLEHVREPPQLLAEAFRVLAPGGKVIVATPNIRYYRHLWSIVVKGRFPMTSDDPRWYDGGHLHSFTSADLAHLAREAGFTDIQREPIVNRDRLARWAPLLGRSFIREFLTSGTMILACKRHPERSA